MSGTVAAVLAAGRSARMGQPKALIEFGGEPLIRRAVRVALGAGCDRTFVVWGAVPLCAPCLGLDATLLFNPQWEEGIAASIRVAAENARGSRLLLMTVDQPLVTSEHLRALLASDAPVVATGYSGIAGIPAVFAPAVLGELLELEGDRGARGVIEAHRRELEVVTLEDAAFDVDSATDLERLRSLGPHVPE